MVGVSRSPVAASQAASGHGPCYVRPASRQRPDAHQARHHETGILGTLANKTSLPLHESEVRTACLAAFALLVRLRHVCSCCCRPRLSSCMKLARLPMLLLGSLGLLLLLLLLAAKQLQVLIGAACSSREPEPTLQVPCMRRCPRRPLQAVWLGGLRPAIRRLSLLRAWPWLRGHMLPELDGLLSLHPACSSALVLQPHILQLPGQVSSIAAQAGLHRLAQGEHSCAGTRDARR